jgi:hypothetical protein
MTWFNPSALWGSETGAVLRIIRRARCLSRNAGLPEVNGFFENNHEARCFVDVVKNVGNDELLVDPEMISGCEDFTGTPIEPDPATLPSPSQLAIDVCNRISIDVSALKGRSRSKNLAEARRRFASCAVDRFGYALKDVAAFLGKHPSSVSRWLETPTNYHAGSVVRL